MTKPAPGPAAAGLKALRSRLVPKMSTRDAREIAGLKGGGYAHYELRFKGKYLPAKLVEKLVPEFARRGVPPDELWALVAPRDNNPLTNVHNSEDPQVNLGDREMTKDEAVLLDKFRRLDYVGQTSLLDRAELLLQSHEKKASSFTGRRSA